MTTTICALEPARTLPAAGLLAARLLAGVAALSVAAYLTAGVPGPARAQADAARDLASDLVRDFDAATADALPPAEILAEVRQEGFYPVGRPAQRGRVYVLYAVDQDDIDVMLTVDAATGRLIRITGAAVHFGGPGSFGWRSIWREHPSVPPDLPAERQGTVPRRVLLRHFTHPPAAAPVTPPE